jgi:hypothetical protein
VIELVGTAHVPVVADADADVIVEDDVGIVFDAALVNVVDVSCTFHPAPDAVRSLGVSATDEVACVSAPLSDTAGSVSVDGDPTDSEPPVQGSLNMAIAAAHEPDFVDVCRSDATTPLVTLVL